MQTCAGIYMYSILLMHVPDSSNVGAVEQVTVTQQYLQSTTDQVIFLHMLKMKLLGPTWECCLTWTCLLFLALWEQVTIYSTEKITSSKIVRYCEWIHMYMYNVHVAIHCTSTIVMYIHVYNSNLPLNKGIEWFVCLLIHHSSSLHNVHLQLSVVTAL